MKTKSLILIVALVSIAAMTYATNVDNNNPFTVKITLKTALQDPYLVKAMHEQIHPNFHTGDIEPHVFSFAIKYKGTRYVISGTYEEWKAFFAMELVGPTPGS